MQAAAILTVFLLPSGLGQLVSILFLIFTLIIVCSACCRLAICVLAE